MRTRNLEIPGRRFPTPRNDQGQFPGLQLAKPLPGLAIETHELHLLNRHVIGRRGVDLDAGSSIGSSRSLML